jgi:hypothetical protein
MLLEHLVTPHTMPRIVADMRKRLSSHPAAPKLMHRLSTIAGQSGLTFRINMTTAGAFLDGDLKACAIIEARVDRMADDYGCDVKAVAVDGTILYSRIAVP